MSCLLAEGCCIWKRMEIKRFYLKIISEADGCHYKGKLLLTMHRIPQRKDIYIELRAGKATCLAGK